MRVLIMNMKKEIVRILALLVALVVGYHALMAEVQQHLVRPGDTLYSIAHRYGVTVEAIQAANPSIVGTNIPTGFMLVIPDAAAGAESAAQNQSTPQTGNASMNPVKGIVVPSYQHVTQTENGDHWTDGTLTMAVILPFQLDAKTAEQNKVQMRSVEFYQGVLMAVEKIQKLGRRVTVQAYDLNTERMADILANPQLLRADFIIAPMDEADVRPVAAWGNAHGTPVVSPFVFNAMMADEFEQLIQINTLKSKLYPQLTDDLVKRFAKYTFVFVTDSVGRKQVDPYPAILKAELTRQGMSYKEIAYQKPERLMACDSLLGLMNEDVIFVPTTPQQDALRRMFSGLQHVKILRDARHQLALTEGTETSGRAPQMAVLGYPEWLLYTHDFVDYYYDLNVYMFSKVYVNPFDEEVKQFYADFKYWYSKEPMSLIPKYAILGYDVALYFLKALSQHGQHLVERLDGEQGESLQTVLSFRRDEAGKGLYNHGLYLVHFTPESSIEKIVIK